MHPFQQQLHDSWRIHEKKLYVLLECVSQAGLEATLSTRGGRSIGQQFVHVHNIRIDQLEVIRKDLAAPLEKLEREQGHDRDVLLAALRASGDAIARLIEETDDGAIKRFQHGLVSFVCYVISHESHHRGGMVLTLKQTKNSLSKDDGWKLWGWSNPKIDA